MDVFLGDKITPVVGKNVKLHLTGPPEEDTLPHTIESSDHISLNNMRNDTKIPLVITYKDEHLGKQVSGLLTYVDIATGQEKRIEFNFTISHNQEFQVLEMYFYFLMNLYMTSGQNDKMQELKTTIDSQTLEFRNRPIVKDTINFLSEFIQSVAMGDASVAFRQYSGPQPSGSFNRMFTSIGSQSMVDQFLEPGSQESSGNSSSTFGQGGFNFPPSIGQFGSIGSLPPIQGGNLMQRSFTCVSTLGPDDV